MTVPLRTSQLPRGHTSDPRWCHSYARSRPGRLRPNRCSSIGRADGCDWSAVSLIERRRAARAAAPLSVGTEGLTALSVDGRRPAMRQRPARARRVVGFHGGLLLGVQPGQPHDQRLLIVILATSVGGRERPRQARDPGHQPCPRTYAARGLMPGCWPCWLTNLRSARAGTGATAPAPCDSQLVPPNLSSARPPPP